MDFFNTLQAKVDGAQLFLTGKPAVDFIVEHSDPVVKAKWLATLAKPAGIKLREVYPNLSPEITDEQLAIQYDSEFVLAIMYPVVVVENGRSMILASITVHRGGRSRR